MSLLNGLSLSESDSSTPNPADSSCALGGVQLRLLLKLYLNGGPAGSGIAPVDTS